MVKLWVKLRRKWWKIQDSLKYSLREVQWKFEDFGELIWKISIGWVCVFFAVLIIFMFGGVVYSLHRLFPWWGEVLAFVTFSAIVIAILGVKRFGNG